MTFVVKYSDTPASGSEPNSVDGRDVPDDPLRRPQRRHHPRRDPLAQPALQGQRRPGPEGHRHRPARPARGSQPPGGTAPAAPARRLLAGIDPMGRSTRRSMIESNVAAASIRRIDHRRGRSTLTLISRLEPVKGMSIASRPQRTIAREARVRGISFLEGRDVELRFRPAEADSGIVFVRSDLPDRPDGPRPRPSTSSLASGGRPSSEARPSSRWSSTSWPRSPASGSTTAWSRSTAPRPPAATARAGPSPRRSLEAGFVEQDAPRDVLVIDRPVTVREGDSVLTAFPGRNRPPGPRLPARLRPEVADRSPELLRRRRPRELPRRAGREPDVPARGRGRRPPQGRDRLEDDRARPADLRPRRGDRQRAPVPRRVRPAQDPRPARRPRPARQGPRRPRRRPPLGALSSTPSSPASCSSSPIARPPPTAPAEAAGPGHRRDPQALPHRYPFLLVDRVLELEPGRRIVALKNVSYNEPFFQGHWPGRPIMPGVLIVEAMAQAAGVLIGHGAETGREALLASIDGVKLRRPVVPGDQLRLEVDERPVQGPGGPGQGRRQGRRPGRRRGEDPVRRWSNCRAAAGTRMISGSMDSRFARTERSRSGKASRRPVTAPREADRSAGSMDGRRPDTSGIRGLTMATLIAETACVDPRAEIAEGVEIGPYCVVGPGRQDRPGYPADRPRLPARRSSRWASRTSSARSPSSAASRRTSPTTGPRPASRSAAITSSARG